MAIQNLQIKNASGEVVSGGTGNLTLKVSADANPGSVQRSQKVYFKVGGVTKKTVSVNQAASDGYITLEQDETSYSKSVANSGETFTVELFTNCSAVFIDGTSASDLPKLYNAEDTLVDYYDGYAAANAAHKGLVENIADNTTRNQISAEFEIPANEDAEEKTYTYVLGCTNSRPTTAGDSLVFDIFTLTVTQAAAEPSLEVSPETLSLNSDGTEEDLTVTSTGDWTVSTTA